MHFIDKRGCALSFAASSLCVLFIAFSLAVIFLFSPSSFELINKEIFILSLKTCSNLIIFKKKEFFFY